MKPGTYRLARDVTNPAPRARVKNDWTKHAVWKAGTKFLVEPIATGSKHVFVRKVGSGLAYTLKQKPLHATPALLASEAAQFEALASALVAIGEDIDALFERLGVDAYDLAAFLKHLVETGVLDDFERRFTKWANA
jgi:hypothetical protein